MSDRAAWLEKWCPTCHATPGPRCRRSRWAGGRGNAAAQLHVARGWLERLCPTCKAPPGEDCLTPTGRPAAQVHTAPLRPARWELASRAAVWDELERRGVSVAMVPFRGRAGQGGEIDVIGLQRVRGEESREVRLWPDVDELAHALVAPVWGRFGTFAGQPLVRADVIWTVDRRSAVIVGRRGDRRLEEIVELARLRAFVSHSTAGRPRLCNPVDPS
jgi:hypothetical protein